MTDIEYLRKYLSEDKIEEEIKKNFLNESSPMIYFVLYLLLVYCLGI